MDGTTFFVYMTKAAEKYLDKFGVVIPISSWTWEKEGKVLIRPKNPLIHNWSVEPLRTKAEIKKNWDKYGRYGRIANIGIPTGQICGGYIVLDFDRHPERGIDGYEVLLDWQHKTGRKLPDSWSVITGSGGYHFWYHTDRPMRSYVNRDIGVDLRADGALIICPPSLHKSGKLYEWETKPSDMPCAEANEDVLAFIDYCRPNGYQYQRQSTRRGEGGERKMILPERIDEGGRTNALVSLIGMMNRAGCLDETIEAAVRSENENKCFPPLAEDELAKTVFPAIYRYEKGVSIEKWKEKPEWIQDQRNQRLREEVMKQFSLEEDRPC